MRGQVFPGQQRIAPSSVTFRSQLLLFRNIYATSTSFYQAPRSTYPPQFCHQHLRTPRTSKMSFLSSSAPTRSSTLDTISRTSDLEQLLLLPSAAEPLFIAIAIKGASAIACKFDQTSNTQVGISILDTRDLHTSFSKEKLQINTINFITGSHQYAIDTAKDAIWGESKYIPAATKTKLLASINGEICRDRNIVLVGHAFMTDITALHALGFDFNTSILGYFDTETMARRLNQGGFTSLDGIFQSFGKSTAKLDNAGVYADYTLRALILMAVKTSSGTRIAQLDGSSSLQHSVLEATMMMPLTLRDLDSYNTKVTESLLHDMRTNAEQGILQGEDSMHGFAKYIVDRDGA